MQRRPSRAPGPGGRPVERAVDRLVPGLGFEFRPGEETGLPPTGERADAAERFREVLGRFATGITVVTSVHDDEPVGLTAQSFASVSLEPPLVLFAPARTSRAWPRMHAAGHFCVNVLGRDQQALSERFASRGTDKFAGVAWRAGRTGSPVLDGAVAWVDCVLHAVHPGGDHHLAVGRVVDLGSAPGEPLLYLDGGYRAPGEGPGRGSGQGPGEGLRPPAG